MEHIKIEQKPWYVDKIAELNQLDNKRTGHVSRHNFLIDRYNIIGLSELNDQTGLHNDDLREAVLKGLEVMINEEANKIGGINSTILRMVK